MDNDPAPDGHRWVTDLHNYLRSALRQRIGLDADALQIFFDPVVQANQQLPDLLDAARDSAIFLAIGSRAWASREFTLAELDAFVRQNPDPTRLFLVEYLPLQSTQKYPDPLQQHVRMRMHLPADSGMAVPLTASENAWRFRELVHQLAEQITLRLLQFRGVSLDRRQARWPRTPTVPLSSSSSCGGGSVLIAQATDDLYGETIQLNEFLVQAGISTRLAGRLPQGGEEFSRLLLDDLATCSLFVQLLGPNRGRTPPDLVAGYTKHQADIAISAGVKVMQWRAPCLDLAEISDQEYLELLDGPNVSCSTLEEFKDSVARAVDRLSSTSSHPTVPSLVFIDADATDSDGAYLLKSEFSRRNFPVVLPLRSLSPQEVRSDLEENLIDSDVILFLYGASKASWVRGQLRLFSKLRHRREGDPKVLAIVRGPPAEKEELDVYVPGARELTSQDAWCADSIRALIDELNP